MGRLRMILVLGVFMLSPNLVAALEVMSQNYRESESTVQHLYQLTCITSGSESTCTLKAASVRSSKSAMACMLSFDTLFENEPAKRTEGGTFVVSLTRGACGYTNTYVFSKAGMVQTKTSPETIPESLKSDCSTFPPKTYNIPIKSGVAGMFEAVPLGDCPKVNVVIH